MSYTNKLNMDKAQTPFATRLRDLSEEHGVSQAMIAEYIGCSYQAIGAYMRGETIPRLTDAQKIAEFFGVSIDYLAGKAECKAPDIQEIHDVIGLSETAIKRLMELRKDYNNSSGSTRPVFHLLSTLIADSETQVPKKHSSLLGTLCDYIYDTLIWIENRTMYGLAQVHFNQDYTINDIELLQYTANSRESEFACAMNIQRVQMALTEFYDLYSQELQEILCSSDDQCSENGHSGKELSPVDIINQIQEFYRDTQTTSTQNTRTQMNSVRIRKKTITHDGKAEFYWEASVNPGTELGLGKQIPQPIIGKTLEEVQLQLNKLLPKEDPDAPH